MKLLLLANILICILSILTLLVFPVMADETEFVDPQENTLRLAESFVRDGFLIEATGFFNNSVLITVYRNNGNDINNDTFMTKIDSNVMRISDSWNVSDIGGTINIVIKDLREDRGNISASEGLNVIVDQWARVVTRMAGAPIPMVSIVPEERHLNNRTFVNRIFSPGSEMTINFTIINVGKAKLKELKLKINTSLNLLFPGDKLNYELSTLEAGDNITIMARFKAPYVDHSGKVGRTNFTISAEATGVDVFGKKYSDNDTTYIIVRPYIEKLVELKKYIPDRVYMGDIVYITLYVKNNGFENMNLTLFDIVPVGFSVLNENMNNHQLSWNITLYSNEERVILYKLFPQKPGIYSFGYACLNAKNIGIECSDIPNKVYNNKLIVSGPYVELTKSIDNVKDNNVGIKITIKNKGDRTAIVRLIDKIPYNYILKSDSSNFNNTIFKTIIIRPQDSSSLRYSLNVENRKNDYILPSAEATILDQFLYQEDKYMQKILSNNLTIKGR